METTKEKIDKFYSFRALAPEITKGKLVDNPRIIEILRLGAILVLPQSMGEGGPRITIIRLGAYDPEKYHLSEIVKVGTMIGDILLEEDDNAIIARKIVIVDLENLTAQHLFQCDTMFVKKLVKIAENVSPIRQKANHFVNAPPGFEIIFNTVKSFLSEKYKKRLFVHGNNMESLYKHVPQKLLPVEYGGTNGNTQDIIDCWEKKFYEYRDYFIEENQLGSNEKLRIGDPINPESLFGISGSFRTLNID